MYLDLAGKNILVTGASSGLGEAITVACAESGARVVLVARNQQRLEEVRDKCSGDNHLVWPLDLTEDLDALPKIVRAICKEVGPLSGLVHSAGIFEVAALRMIRRKQMERLFTINTAAAILLTKGLSIKGNYLPGTSVVIISSITGHRALPGTVAYASSKSAVTQAAKAMAIELIPQKIRVNCIAPAVIETPLVEEFYKDTGEDTSRKLLEELHPGGFGEPEDVSSAAIYLLSDASKYVNGTTLFVDGGIMAS